MIFEAFSIDTEGMSKTGNVTTSLTSNTSSASPSPSTSTATSTAAEVKREYRKGDRVWYYKALQPASDVAPSDAVFSSFLEAYEHREHIILHLADVVASTTTTSLTSTTRSASFPPATCPRHPPLLAHQQRSRLTYVTCSPTTRQRRR